MDWFKVIAENDKIILDVTPGRIAPWYVEISWDQIIKICYQTGSIFDSDEIYIFVNYRPESYVIPSEASGADRLWGLIIDKGYFDPKLAIDLMKTEGELGCYP